MCLGRVGRKVDYDLGWVCFSGCQLEMGSSCIVRYFEIRLRGNICLIDRFVSRILGYFIFGEIRFKVRWQSYLVNGLGRSDVEGKRRGNNQMGYVVQCIKGEDFVLYFKVYQKVYVKEE